MTQHIQMLGGQMYQSQEAPVDMGGEPSADGASAEDEDVIDAEFTDA